MALLLNFLGARVIGLSLDPGTQPNMFEILLPWRNLKSLRCDVRDRDALSRAVDEARPEIVIHMAAQSLVRESYRDPVGTIGTNVLGTVNLLDVLRQVPDLAAVLVVTSDKVYQNREGGLAFAESAPLGGHDPYSASKAAAEILTSAYARSFYDGRGIPVCTARAGNVIGGGDWGHDRLIPDLWRAFASGRQVPLRNPGAVRPWQHVLDPLHGYLLYVQRCLTAPATISSSLNFGPPSEPRRTVLEIARCFADSMGSNTLWTFDPAIGDLHENQYLAIDSSAAFSELGWKTQLEVDEAMSWTCDWYRAFHNGETMRAVTQKQIEVFARRIAESAMGRPITELERS
jgi:CDP-glucose 4,6-dehydratase